MGDSVRALSAPIPRVHSHSHSRKSKSVTFTGCWTCRSRKVKCDERQINGCGVCERANLKCAGYGVNLCWVTGAKQDLHGLKRRKIQLEQSNSPSMSDEEIGQTLTTLDMVSAPSNTVTMGPFAVFNAQIQAGGDHQECGEVLFQETQTSPDTAHGDNSAWNVDANATLVKHQHPRRAEYAGENDSLTALSKKTPNGTFNEHLLQQSAARSSSLPSPHLEISMPLFRDSQTAMLMYHYMNHVADLLQPILHPGNPWRTTYIPFALRGCPDLTLSQASASPDASLALFHSLLSSAAFHLRNVTGGCKKLHNLGLHHRAKSLRVLNAALLHPDDPEQHAVYLTAMLSLVTIDTVTGEDTDYPIHLEGCRQLQKSPSYSVFLHDSGQPVNSICHFLSLLARTTAPDPQPRIWRTDGPIFNLTHFQNDERSMEHIYGITPALGNQLEKTCQIAEYLAFYQDCNIPSDLLEACEALKLELSQWTIESEPFRSIGGEQTTMLEIARCQARAFHSAVLIFYFRTIEKHNSIDLGEEVQTVWENLTAAEDLKDQVMGGEKRAAPMSWPAFIAACEASDRQPWVEWWVRIQGYRLGNFTRQWKIIQELWGIMDADENVTTWREALKQSGKLVLPI